MEKIGEKLSNGNKIEFYLDEGDNGLYLVTKSGNKSVKSVYITTVKQTKVVSASGLELNVNGQKADWVSVPDSVISKFEKSKSEYNNRHVSLVSAGKSMSSGINWYALDRRITYDVWQKVKDLFTYIRPYSDDDESDGMFGEEISGWVTSAPSEVEKRLNITGERTVEYKKNKRENELKMSRQKAMKINNGLQEIHTSFANAVSPKPDKGLMVIEGEVIQHPKYPENIYGGGRWWVIEDKKYIWEIKNNGSDGDNWDINNVATGGAGAIGRRVKYTSALASKIRQIGKVV